MSCFSPTKEQDRGNDLKMISFHKFFQAQVLAGKVTVPCEPFRWLLTT
jgi:hypothetical protein